MSERADAANVIDETLNAIAGDDVSSLVAGAVQHAWTGQEFDEAALRDALVALADEEESA
jgi:hypothetical protein